MADISKVKLPSGNVYDIKDAVARQAIAGGISFIIAWNGTSTPVVGDIPAGVVVTYNSTSYTGTLAASSAQPGAFYLVKSSTQVGSLDIYDEYAVITSGNTKSWEKIGDTDLDLSSLKALAYMDNVTLYKGGGDNVLGEATTFTTSVTPTTTNIKATASGTAVGADGTDTFVKSYPGASSKLATTTVTGTNGTDTATLVSSKVSKKLTTTSVPNVTSAGAASTWSFTMGSDNTGSGGSDESETLIIGGANGSAPTLGTAITCATGGLSETSASSNVGGEVVSSFSTSDKTLAKVASSSTTVATGSLDANGGGASVMTGLGTATTASALTGVKVTTQPTIALATGATAGTGVISVATGITSASTTAGTNDKVAVAKYSDITAGTGMVVTTSAS